MTVIPVVYTKGQYNHLITRRLQDLGVESKLLPAGATVEDLKALGADALVMGGGPQRVRKIDDLTPELSSAAQLIKDVQLPLLCICVTHQLMATVYGGQTGAAPRPEFGPVKVSVKDEDSILRGTGPSFTAWESHNDEVSRLPEGFHLLASSENCRVQAMRHEKRILYGVQFHPEVSHTTKGEDVFKNFLRVVQEHKRT
ncbi:MAG TPA: GMP synthase subunit A [Candidatus Binatus sp.]|nr:GMP synthase subunit A [Candidatus Binatus sp.]